MCKNIFEILPFPVRCSMLRASIAVVVIFVVFLCVLIYLMYRERMFVSIFNICYFNIFILNTFVIIHFEYRLFNIYRIKFIGVLTIGNCNKLSKYPTKIFNEVMDTNFRRIK